MTKRPASEVLRRWRIVEIEGSDTGYVVCSAPVRSSSTAVAATSSLVRSRSHRLLASETGAHFTFQGSDEGTEVSGDSDADLAEEGNLTGELRFQNGGDMPFIARRWRTSAVC